MRLINHSIAAAALAFSFVAAPAFAQTGEATDSPAECNGHRGRRGHGPGMRHGMHRVLRQLSLTENQQAQVRAIMDSAREQHNDLRGNEGEGGREAHRAIMQETRRLIREVLTPAQRQQARTLMVEHRNEHIDRRVSRLTERLSLNDSQASRIRAILEGAHPAPPADGSEPDFEAMRNRRSAVRASIEAVLTPEQVETFRTMRPERRGRGEHGERGRRGGRGGRGANAQR